MVDEAINIIVRQILGEKAYIKLIEECAHYCEEFSESTINKELHDISPMLDSCCIVILMIGLSNEETFLDKYRIKFDKERIVEIKNKDFCIKFKKYIDKVGSFKEEMLVKIT